MFTVLIEHCVEQDLYSVSQIVIYFRLLNGDVLWRFILLADKTLLEDTSIIECVITAMYAFRTSKFRRPVVHERTCTPTRLQY